jgi:hypothetical protein
MLDLPLPLVRATESALSLLAASVLGALALCCSCSAFLSSILLDVVSGSDPSVDS